MSSNDPLLQPYRLKQLTLRNRLMSTGHEPAYTDEGMAKDRYRGRRSPGSRYRSRRSEEGLRVA